jgi:hypothetical protein
VGEGAARPTGLHQTVKGSQQGVARPAGRRPRTRPRRRRRLWRRLSFDFPVQVCWADLQYRNDRRAGGERARPVDPLNCLFMRPRAGPAARLSLVYLNLEVVLVAQRASALHSNAYAHAIASGEKVTLRKGQLPEWAETGCTDRPWWRGCHWLFETVSAVFRRQGGQGASAWIAGQFPGAR